MARYSCSDDRPITTSRIGFLSHDGKTPIKACLWMPRKGSDTSPRGIIQIVHGMAEHIERYDDFASHLARQGYVVCGHDHIGHGKSVDDPASWGCLPAQGGKETLIEDMHELRRTVAARFSRQTPYVLLGHSMGSFIVRCYLARYGEGVAAVVLSGTGQQSALLSRFGNVMARRTASSKGQDHKSQFLHNLGAGAFAKKMESPRTEFDWISTDEEVVDAYVADEACGVMFSAGGYATLTDLTGEMVKTSCVESVPKSIPILFVSGALDVVSENGKGVLKAAEMFRRAGVRDVDVKLFEGMRHEILNERGKDEVYAYILQWIEEKTA